MNNRDGRKSFCMTIAHIGWLVCQFHGISTRFSDNISVNNRSGAKMKRVLSSLLVLSFMSSAAFADFQLARKQAPYTAGDDQKTIHGMAPDGTTLTWAGDGTHPTLGKDEKFVLLLSSAGKFICDKAAGEYQTLYWAGIDADGEERDTQEISLVVDKENYLIGGGALAPKVDQEKLSQFFEAFKYQAAIRLYHDEDCGDAGFTDISTQGFIPAVIDYNYQSLQARYNLN
jgi:hypothetical protein